MYCVVTEALFSKANNNLKQIIIITYMYKCYKHIIDVAQRIRNVITKNRVTSLPCFTAGLCITALPFSWVRELLRRAREAENLYSSIKWRLQRACATGRGAEGVWCVGGGGKGLCTWQRKLASRGKQPKKAKISRSLQTSHSNSVGSAHV